MHEKTNGGIGSMHWINIPATDFVFLEKFLERAAGTLPIFNRADLERTLKVIKDHPAFKMDEVRRFEEIASGSFYWTMFLEGVDLFLEHGEVTPENTHYLFVKEALEVANYDPDLLVRFSDEKYALNRVQLRFESFLDFMDGAASSKIPITLYTGLGSHQSIVNTVGESVKWNRLDGYHRVFAAKVTATQAIPYVIKLA